MAWRPLTFLSIYLTAGRPISKHIVCHVQQDMLFYHCVLMGHDFSALKWLQLSIDTLRSFLMNVSNHLPNMHMHFLIEHGSFSEYKWDIIKHTTEKRFTDKYPHHLSSVIRWHPTTRRLTNPSTPIHHRLVAHGLNRSCHHHRVEHH